MKLNQFLVSQIDKKISNQAFRWCTTVIVRSSPVNSALTGNRQATRSRSPADFAAVPGATASKMWTQQRDSTDVLHNILHYVETRQAIACCPAGTSKFCSLVILAGFSLAYLRDPLKNGRYASCFYSILLHHLTGIRVKILTVESPRKELRNHSVCIFVSWTVDVFFTTAGPRVTSNTGSCDLFFRMLIVVGWCGICPQNYHCGCIPMLIWLILSNSHVQWLCPQRICGTAPHGLGSHIVDLYYWGDGLGMVRVPPPQKVVYLEPGRFSRAPPSEKYKKNK